MHQNYLLYQAYGKKEVKYECKFALMQLLTFDYSKQICPVIYTDDVDFFKEILKNYEHSIVRLIHKEEIVKWRGKIDFVHRVKIEIITDFLNTHTGNLIYCDTDTYFLRSPELIYKGIEEGNFYMHRMEGHINSRTDKQFKKWEKFLTGNNNILKSSSKEDVNQLQMWNAGVIGMNSSKKHLLEEVLSLTDKIYITFKKHIAEQFAFSYVLGKAGEILATEAIIYHYWYLKEYAAYLESKFLENDNENIIHLLKSIDKLPEQLLEKKLKFEKKPKLVRWFIGQWKL